MHGVEMKWILGLRRNSEADWAPDSIAASVARSMALWARWPGSIWEEQSAKCLVERSTNRRSRERPESDKMRAHLRDASASLCQYARGIGRFRNGGERIGESRRAHSSRLPF